MKFTIRDLFLVTVIVALAVGWWLERRKSTALSERVNELEQGYLGLEPGSYEIVPLNQAKDSTAKRLISVEVMQKAEEPAPNPPKSP